MSPTPVRTKIPDVPETSNNESAFELEIPESDIAPVAYALWEKRGCPEGSPEEDWFRAVQEVRAGRELRFD
jgi:hypothetical protein